MSAPNTPKTPDPILTHSLSWPLFLAAVLLMASTLWAMYDEFFGKRPWAEYQDKFVATYGTYLDQISPARNQVQQTIEARDDYKALKAEYTQATDAAKDELSALGEKLSHTVQPRIDDLTKAMVDPKSQVSAKTYDIEHAAGAGDMAAKEKCEKQLADIKATKYECVVRKTPIPKEGAAETETLMLNFDEIGAALQAAKDEKTAILAKQAELSAPAGAIFKRMQAIEDLYKTGLTPEELAKVRDDLGNFRVEIKQIHVKDVDLVDRCESCHVGIRKPGNMTYEAALQILGAGNEKYAKAFAAHPKGADALLKIHDPEKFGCSPCHGGNGVGTTDPFRAHGLNHHWLWPLHDKENTEAGCLQCHQTELRLEHSTTLNAGKELFRHLGCWGCHPRDGFQVQKNDLLAVNQNLKDVEEGRRKLAKMIEDNKVKQDNLPDDQVEKMIPILAKEAEQYTLQISSLTAQEQALRTQQTGLFKEMKKVGPNLKMVRAKLNRDWVPVWISKPRGFRPDTRMPQFRFENEDVVKDIAAFIWQSGNDVTAPKQTPGDATKGQDLFEKRGCLACHSIGEGEARHGGDFAANLSRVGEKANYDYLVHWVQHPDKRLTPYNHTEMRDYTAEEAKTIPATDAAWDQAVIMPNLRLSDEDAKDIASYLVTQKHADAQYPAADYMEDKSRFERGKTWVKHFGCAGCHEIAGLEKENGIGTDLTKEGSKPIDRLDFGLLTEKAEVGETWEGDPFKAEFEGREGEESRWYTHKGFFKRKLKQPEIFDYEKHDTKSPTERLKMPNFGLKDEEIVQLTTFLLGSVDSNLPERFYFHPEGAQKDIADGWWVVQKYNCIGCHQFEPGQLPNIQKLPQFRDENKGLAPPNLVGEGARVDPEWLTQFLRNPSLSTEHVNRNGVRPYLQVRMPTFSLSEREIQTLVRFFAALAKQPSPYVRPQFKPLTAEEKTMARGILREQCTRCHASGDMEVYPKEIIAPNLLWAAQRLKPTWVERWVIKPSAIFPGTNMPDGLFQYNETVKKFTIDSKVPGVKDYTGDHRDLIVNYLAEFNAAEAELLQAGK